MASVELIDGDVELIHIRTWHSTVLDLTVYAPFIENSLFDSTQAKGRKQILSVMQNRNLERIIHTHGHEDHIGNDFQLMRKHNCEIWAPRKSFPLLTQKQNLAPYRRFFWGTPTPLRESAITEVPAEFQLGKFQFQTVPTPGHSEDLVGYFEPNRRWFIGGDLFLGEHIRTAMHWENGNHAIESLQRVIDLKPRIFFCYHKGALLDPIPRLQAKLNFYREVSEETQRLHKTGMPTKKIVEKILGPDKPIHIFAFSREVTKLNFILSFLKPPGFFDPIAPTES